MTKLGMKRTGPRARLKLVSEKQKPELALRRKVRAELMAKSDGRCQKCGRLPDFRGLHMHHKTHLSEKVITDTENCELICAPCHFGAEGHRTEGRIHGRYQKEN